MLTGPFGAAVSRRQHAGPASGAAWCRAHQRSGQFALAPTCSDSGQSGHFRLACWTREFWRRGQPPAALGPSQGWHGSAVPTSAVIKSRRRSRAAPLGMVVVRDQHTGSGRPVGVVNADRHGVPLSAGAMDLQDQRPGQLVAQHRAGLSRAAQVTGFRAFTVGMEPSSAPARRVTAGARRGQGARACWSK